jgi:exo-1,4-beta-D-glucosaminidase
MQVKLRIIAAAMMMLGFCGAGVTKATASETFLREGWSLQSGCKIHDGGEVISTPSFGAVDWYKATVPTTVLAAQVATGEFKEPYFGTNLRKIPGTTYPVGENFSNLPMPADSPYHCSWWYRKEFVIPATDRGMSTWLRFVGINYRANVWLNGKRIADSAKVAGAYRTYEFDISSYVVPGKSNAVAVETFAPSETELGVNWVDWNPCPPDKDMGLTGPVTLATSGPVTLRSPMVTTHLPKNDVSSAELTVYVDVHNRSDRDVKGVLSGSVSGIPIQQEVTLKGGEARTVVFTPDSFGELRIRNPKLWWPYQMGPPNMETLSLQFAEGGKVSDQQTTRFGIREVTSELTDKGYRLFRVNGKPILIRGAGWSQDMMLREDSKRLAEQFRLVRDMNLNTIRLEGKLETEEFYRLADEQGILVMAGWCCCDHWEHWDKWNGDTLDVAVASLRSQMLRIRHHPSLLVWLNGSDGPPPENVERAYLAVEAETHWPNPVLSSASATPTTLTGKSGVKMTGPYDYVSPSYWLVDTGHYGGAYGFNTETSPGAAIPSIHGLQKFIPADGMWPPSADWSYHNGGEGFKNLDVFNTAMKSTYGSTDSLAAYVRIAQTMAYDGERAMFEAYGRNKYTSTGIVQWMLNNAWPSMIWHLYDYYLEAGGGYFGTKKACEPLHIQYSYDDHSIAVVNGRYQSVKGLKASAHLYDQNLVELFSREVNLNVDADSSTIAMALPASAFSGSSPVLFVELSLRNAGGEVLSNNFYWVPAKLTQFDWSKTDYTHTPAISYEDLTILRSLPISAVEAQVEMKSTGQGEKSIRLSLHNPSKRLAFQVSLEAMDTDGRPKTAVLWSDNYLELMPGETRTLTAQIPASVALSAVHISGWNFPDKVVAIKEYSTAADISRK